MNTKQKLFAAATMMLAACSALAQTLELDGVKYELNAASHEASASYADATMTHAIVAASVAYEGTDYAVTALADKAFFGCRGLQSIVLPETLLSAGTFAFLGCDELVRVDIPSLESWLSIAFADAFSNPLIYAHDLYIDNNILKALSLPDGLEKVPDNVFAGASITSVHFPASVTEIGKFAFHQCESLTSFETGASVAVIGTQAVDDCTALKSVVLGSSVTEVGSYAFSGCTALEKVTFGQAVTTVRADAFAGCEALAAVEVPDIATWCRIDFANSAANPLLQAHVLMMNGDVVTVLEIPAGITEVKANSFSGCTELESVVLGTDVTTLGDNAFSSCPALRSVTFNGPVTAIGDSAFEGCENLTDCVLPSTLSQIGRYSFYKTSLGAVEVPVGVTVLPDGVFGECTQLATLQLPEGLTSLGFGCFFECSSLEHIELPQSLKKIGKSAFNGCSALQSAKLGEAVESVSAFAFGSCPALTDVYVEAIEPPVAPENAFSNYTATLHVPQAAIEAYTADSTWGLFSNIDPMAGVGNTISCGSITVRGNIISFSNMDGTVEIVCIDGSTVYRGPAVPVTVAPGVYIIRTGKNATKLIVK